MRPAILCNQPISTKHTRQDSHTNQDIPSDNSSPFGQNQHETKKNLHLACHIEVSDKQMQTASQAGMSTRCWQNNSKSSTPNSQKTEIKSKTPVCHRPPGKKSILAIDTQEKDFGVKFDNELKFRFTLQRQQAEQEESWVSLSTHLKPWTKGCS